MPFNPGSGPYYNVPYQPPNRVHDIFVVRFMIQLSAF
eukprot:COSAG06_NODE_5128_length_3698_cov_1.762156_1_plen_36_part_10